MKIERIILAVTLIAGLSCNKSVEPPTVAQYVQTTGSSWSYLATARVTNIRILQPGVVIGDTSQEWTALTTCEGPDTLHDSVATVRFRSTESDGFSGRIYYVSIHDTLFWYAYAGTAEVLPKRSPSLTYHFAGRSFSSIPQLVRTFASGMGSSTQAPDSIIYEYWPPKALVFPLRTNAEWAFREKGYPIWLIHKKVTGTAEVAAANVSYPCYVINWLWDMNDDGAWDTSLEQHDYMHSAGLIKRTMVIKDLVLTGSDPTPLAKVDLTADYVLTSTTVH